MSVVRRFGPEQPRLLKRPRYRAHAAPLPVLSSPSREYTLCMARKCLALFTWLREIRHGPSRCLFYTVLHAALPGERELRHDGAFSRASTSAGVAGRRIVARHT